ncbi:flavin reductase family protein [Roseomonas sp. GC11]|uniref:flavin reductase family protein n=1 Tax=Roseomonas sp. GC11 TaxID=2950546 RepID=UPI002109FFC6|nr:flavin reductase family protein [Roseomonas sp. GC11]MCQ4159085.1 flavin reductase family protein [Roseomonas sp. GC11]
MTDSTGFDFARLSARERYKILIGTVIPRPIAWVTTRDAAGRANAAPYSFFNCLSADPAIVALGIEFRPDGAPKDTARNIRDTGCFTVNIVSDALAEAMNVTATPFGAGVDELEKAGLATAPGLAVSAPRILAAPAALECRLHSFLAISASREIVLGEVVYAHIRSDAVDERLHVDPAVIDALGRMGGQGYARTRERFDLPTMSVAQFEGGAPPPHPRRGN